MELENLTSSDFLNIFSILFTAVSILFGIWGIYVSVYRVKYPGKLTYTPIKTVNIYENIINSFPNLSIQHNGISIENELVYHRSAVLNTGKIDIKRDMIEEPISIFLKNGEWKEARIKSSPSIKSSITIGIDKKSLHLETGLLRIDEAIQYEALATLNENLDSIPLIDHIKITHRISDIESIEKSDRMSIEGIRSTLSQGRFTMRMLFAILAFGFMIPIGLLLTQPDKIITISLPHSKATYILSKANDNSIVLSDINSFRTYKSIKTDSSTLSKITYTPTALSYYQKSRVVSAVYIIPTFITVYMLIFGWILYRNQNKYLKLEKIFALTSE
jgi:hypothetical protein